MKHRYLFTCTNDDPQSFTLVFPLGFAYLTMGRINFHHRLLPFVAYCWFFAVVKKRTSEDAAQRSADPAAINQVTNPISDGQTNLNVWELPRKSYATFNFNTFMINHLW